MPSTDFLPLQFDRCTRFGEFKWWNTTCMLRLIYIIYHDSCWQCKSKVNIDLKALDRLWDRWMEKCGEINWNDWKNLLTFSTCSQYTNGVVVTIQFISCSCWTDDLNWENCALCRACYVKWCTNTPTHTHVFGALTLDQLPRVVQQYCSMFTSIYTNQQVLFDLPPKATT